ncbi:MAG TPA: DUF1542 domain-containing protein [Flavisolibacter sp.]|nr:DUF1542 domain-containing protein [Flavisolibacter sp.]
MKKLLTILFALGALVSAHAQTSKDQARRVILGQPKNAPNTSNPRDVILGGGNNGGNYPNSYPGNYPSGSSQGQIDQVNREYDSKIQSIRNNPYLSQAEKDRAIRQLENDRARRIRAINGQNGNYSRKNGKRHYDDDNDEQYEGRHDNGKHLGWEKGKGNPHRKGGKGKWKD